MKLIRTLLVALPLAAFFLSAFAFDPDLKAMEDGALFERFPKGTISTRETADQVLKEVRSAKSRLKELAAYSKRRCNENIFVNSCLEDVRKAELRQSRKLSTLETEARRVVRQDEARREVERQKKRDARAAQPPKIVKKAEPRSPASARQNAAQMRRTHAKRMKALEERKAQEAQKAAKEAANRAAYEKKVAEREKRRAERAKALEKRAARKATQAQEAQKKAAAAQSGDEAK